MEIITRAEAKERGLKRYFTGKPCKHGHVLERFLASGDCVQCGRDKSAISQRKADPAKRKASARRFREINPDYWVADPIKKRERDRRYRAANPEKLKEMGLRQRTKRKCAEVIAKVAAGAESAKANGTLLDMRDAIDIFKAHGNAFDFVESDEDISF